MSAHSATKSGVLYIVATPIGNLDDISLRACSTLKSVDTILAEDTRHSQQLLQALGIKKPCISLHAHNEAHKTESIITALLAGQSFALISDAGTPLISDPGYPLVKQAHAADISVVPIPGACALIAALSAAGVACDTFTFSGFLPAKSAARREKILSLAPLQHTLVFYESTHRILDSIDDMVTILGSETLIVLAKELTKTFERFVSGSGPVIRAWLTEDLTRCKGEFVLIVPPRALPDETARNRALLKSLLAELPLKPAVKIAQQLTLQPKNILYKIALDLQKD
jgi:16S rRNA (cytidine1402-2'-O)-methyltransferase